MDLPLLEQRRVQAPAAGEPMRGARNCPTIAGAMGVLKSIRLGPMWVSTE